MDDEDKKRRFLEPLQYIWENVHYLIKVGSTDGEAVTAHGGEETAESFEWDPLFCMIRLLIQSPPLAQRQCLHDFTVFDGKNGIFST